MAASIALLLAPCSDHANTNADECAVTVICSLFALGVIAVSSQ